MAKGNLSAMFGLRYRNHSMFLDAGEISSSIRPEHLDAQAYVSLLPQERFRVDLLGHLSVNSYRYEPETRRTKFGSLLDPRELVVFYEGQEKDRYRTSYAALRGLYIVNDHCNAELSTSLYHSKEKEHFDIAAEYNVGELNTDIGSDDFGSLEDFSAIGSQINHARNGIDGLYLKGNVKVNYRKDNSRLEFGMTLAKEDFRDRLKEWEVIDSVGFHIRPPDHQLNEQPYEPFVGPLLPFQSIDAYNELIINRVYGFIQYSKRKDIATGTAWFNLGVRGHRWQVKHRENNFNDAVVSARGQLAFQPDWTSDMVFRLSGGLYHQPPSLKELRDLEGNVNIKVRAQRSAHLVLAHHYGFRLWNRPFKLETELYYKDLSDLNRYTLDNVRIRYLANNDARGYATGIDIRLNGEFVPGTESWISMGLLKTEEKENGRSYLARPTDQRFKFAMMFQDYVPNIPHLKMYLNLIYNSGLPGGSPAYADPYDYTFRLNAYKRADLGISYVLSEAQGWKDSRFGKNMNYLAVGFQLFNMFDVRNSITTTWVRDAYSKSFYGVPNYMSPRVFNLTVDLRF
jgi:hypothetical protein